MEHPDPTTATIKALYAHAMFCAFQGCLEPLYQEDESTGRWTLNSRICHICARSEGGPRWNPHQTSEANRSLANLVLMCTKHASQIDDEKLVPQYPPELLRSWKREQVKTHQRLREGWPLTSAMAEEARKASFSPGGITIVNSTLNLGGEGGKAPGAGGGGGGAIGLGARAGRGGAGGQTFDGEGNLIEDAPPLELPTSHPFDPPPGSGGGGGGAIGPRSVGGDGGNGGDRVIATLDVEPGDEFICTVGKGAEGPLLLGQHPPAGEDTTVMVKSPTGAIKHILRAKGGASARSGVIPDDWSGVSIEDIASGLCISTLMLAKAIEWSAGYSYILGGGWNSFSVPALPFNAIWKLICIASWGDLALADTRGLQLRLVDPGGAEVSCLALSLPDDAIPAGSYTWIQDLGAPLTSEGIWNVLIESGGLQLANLPVHIRLEA